MSSRRSFLQSLLAIAVGSAIGVKEALGAEKAISAVSSVLPVGTISTGSWHHVALTRSASATTLYLNGRAVSDIDNIEVEADLEKISLSLPEQGNFLSVPTTMNLSDSDFTLEFWCKRPESDGSQLSDLRLTRGVIRDAEVEYAKGILTHESMSSMK